MSELVPSVLKHKAMSGALMALGIAFSLSPWGSAATALLLGVLVAVLSGNPFVDYTKKYAQNLLALSIVGLGAGMNLVAVGAAGLSGLGVTVVTITLTLLLGVMLGRLLKSDRETSLLISVGTAICGGSAIAAIAPVMRAKPHAIAVALGTVFLLNAVALVLFPILGHFLELSQRQFGLWSALAIHDTSSVVGAGLQYGADALQIGTTVKLARALWIVPLTLAFGFWYRDAAQQGKVKTKKPWFILGFLLMAALVTWVPALQGVGHDIEGVARKGLVVALFLIGSNLTVDTLKQVGLRPLLLGVALWVVVAVSTLLLVKYVSL